MESELGEKRPLGPLVHVIASVAPSDGGSTRAVADMLSGLHACGADVTLVTTEIDGIESHLSPREAERIVGDGIHLRVSRANAPRSFKMSWGLPAALWRATHDASLIHIHGLYLWHDVVAWAVATVRRIPYVLQPHGGFEPYHRHHHQIRKKVFDWFIGERIIRDAAAILVTALSEAANVPLVAGRVHVLPLGVPDVESPVTHLPPAVAAAVDTPAPVVLSYGRLTAKKNPDLLVRAWSLVQRDHPGARLVFVGPEGDVTYSGLRSLIRDAGLSGSVFVVGSVRREAQAALFASVAMFVLPSANENFSLAAAEAMMSGIPCILSAYVGVAQMPGAAASVAVVDDLSASTWASEISRLLSSPSDRLELAERGRRFAAAEFGLAARSEELIAFYRGLV